MFITHCLTGLQKLEIKNAEIETVSIIESVESQYIWGTSIPSRLNRSRRKLTRSTVLTPNLFLSVSPHVAFAGLEAVKLSELDYCFSYAPNYFINHRKCSTNMRKKWGGGSH